ncbi:MAG: hypothetical protein KatS3mg042_1544 [Rhodothermaceae bacterium]|nr:MAG: hypothetical protein KatS3mg042_1544 [Rhodothermaceae bacterium]
MKRTATLLSRRTLAGLLAALVVLTARGQAPAEKVLVGNQGNFSDANGSVTAYDPATGTVTVDAVPGLNTLVQSLTLHDGRGYVMANTSDRVDVFDVATLQRTAQITGVPSPRYLAVVDAGKAYVTNLVFGGPGTVTVLDLATNTVAGTITVGDSPEGLAVHGGRAYVANSGFGFSTTVSVIDTATDAVVETRDVGCDGPRFVAVDAEEEVWVFCTGKTVYNDDFTQIIEQTNGAVVVYDGASGQEVARLPLDVQIGGGSLGQDVYYDPITEQAFALAGTTVLVFDTDANAQSGTIALAGDTPAGGLAYDGAARRLYVGRVPGFVESGFVTIHDDTGAEVGRFDAGVAPAAVALYQPGLNVAAETEAPTPALVLAPNYPEPFSQATTIPFVLDRPTRVALRVYDLLGREVAVLAEGLLPAGRHEAVWEAGALPAGLYLVRLQAGDTVLTRTLTRTK